MVKSSLHEQIRVKEKKRKPIKFRIFNYEDKIIELNKVYENVFIKGTKYHNVPEDIEYMSVSYGEDKKIKCRSV